MFPKANEITHYFVILNIFAALFFCEEQSALGAKDSYLVMSKLTLLWLC